MEIRTFYLAPVDFDFNMRHIAHVIHVRFYPMVFKLFDLEGTDVLAGSLTGRRVLGALLERIGQAELTAPAPAFLDFHGIEVATASFLREGVLEFRETVRDRQPKCYPVFANVNSVVTEELSILIRSTRTVLMLCSLDDAERSSAPRLLGDLDPKQQITFDLVRTQRITDAAQLARDYQDIEHPVSQNAWNNRLAALSKLGIIVESNSGRNKYYSPLPIGD